MNYPAKPWTDGQTFVENGTVYTYDLSTNSWRFNKLTYNRLQNAISADVPEGSHSVKVEFSKDYGFNSIEASYTSSSADDRLKMMVATPLGVFAGVFNSEIDSTQYSKFFIIPDLDLNVRHYGRLRWISNGTVVKTIAFIVPGQTI